MLHIAWPWMLLALPLPWLAARLLPSAQPRGGAVFLPFAAGVDADTPQRVRRLPPLRSVLLIAVWLLLVGAAVRPQWLGEPQSIATTGRRLLLAVDVSRSMGEEDMAGNYSRLQVVQALGGQFIEGRKGDQVGLILFGTQPYLQAPLTTDLDTTRQFLMQSMIGMAGTQTAVGDAIGLALKRLGEAGKDSPAEDEARRLAGETVLILLTDGRNTAGAMPPLEAAKLAAQRGLKIYTIGVGAESQGGFLGLSVGNSDLDEETLQQIASMTGGAYFRATDARALQQVYARLDQLEPSAGREQWFRPTVEYYLWPLGLALLLSVPALVLRQRP
jgi:Ca-activated chloride channel family protein